ncbi:hypothetical protein [Nitratidesulfovibrio sp. 1201_IL3209]|uniref:hypothetical protein n=1 Tax=Nitratidesulfovibrio sp. 1201_IL3209 TaxID=3084053 RepID=UPI002FD97CC6
MALIKCPECQKDVSDAAYDCPGCGAPLRRRFPRNERAPERPRGPSGKPFGAKRWFVVFAFVAVAVALTKMFGGCFGNSAPSGTPSARSSSANDMSAEKAAALMLNLNGHLCAEAVRITPLKQPKVYEVRCIEYRGGRGTVDYVLDMNTGVGWRR